MLARYSIVRGAPASSLPKGIRQDTRKHTRHVLRPTADMVEEVLGRADDASAWRTFTTNYRALLDARFSEDRGPFDALADLAREGDVYLGCNCPTAKNPDVRRCHTALALAFMKKHYPDLDVRKP
ncbi:hypothetical protein LVJ94_01225 [Pendulispora rubella]|uniref:DUF488 domain-containing protein n=1 Tax=Pendulispora rubella TaxID=2741070 RepID=A0ABZ2L4M6_9BACT